MTYKVLIKSSVKFKEFKEQIVRLFHWLQIIANHIEHDITITSGNDSKHQPESLHFKDLAIDTRTRDLFHYQIEDILRFAKNMDYSNDYDIIYEPDKMHIHWEYDPK